MSRIAASMIGAMFSARLLSMVVVPAWLLMRRRGGDAPWRRDKADGGAYAHSGGNGVSLTDRDQR